MEALGKIWSIIICFVLIFLCPIYLAEERKAALEDIMAVSCADTFLDNLRYSGYIDKDGLESFIKSLTVLADGKKVTLRHKRRAIRPIFKNGKPVDTEEFYIEIDYEEIKRKLSENGRYRFAIGDEVNLVMTDKKRIFTLFPGQNIELGGMVENEYIKD